MRITTVAAYAAALFPTSAAADWSTAPEKPMFWTATQYLLGTPTILSHTITKATGSPTTSTEVWTYYNTQQLRAGYTPPADASIVSAVTTTLYRENLYLVQKILAQDVSVASSDYISAEGYLDYGTLYGFVETSTAPDWCPTGFTWAFPHMWDLPVAIEDQITATSTKITTTTNAYNQTYSWVSLFVDKTSAPSATSRDEEDWMMSHCQQLTRLGWQVGTDTPRAAATSWDSPYIHAAQEKINRPDIFWKECPYDRHRQNETYPFHRALATIDFNDLCWELKPWVRAVIVVIPTIFVFGFVESFFWYYRLMEGCWTLRLGTISWILICPWVALYTKTSPQMPLEISKLLQEERRALSFTGSYAHWFKWAFCWEHPMDARRETEQTDFLGPPQYEPADVPDRGHSSEIERPVSPLSTLDEPVVTQADDAPIASNVERT